MMDFNRLLVAVDSAVNAEVAAESEERHRLAELAANQKAAEKDYHTFMEGLEKTEQLKEVKPELVQVVLEYATDLMWRRHGIDLLPEMLDIPKGREGISVVAALVAEGENHGEFRINILKPSKGGSK